MIFDTFVCFCLLLNVNYRVIVFGGAFCVIGGNVAYYFNSLKKKIMFL